MNDAKRPRAELLAELERLRRQVSALEQERQATARVLHGDPQHREGPLVEQMPAVVWTTDTNLRLTWWTGGGIRSIGSKGQTELGTDIFTFLETDDASTPAIAAHRSALDGVAASYEQVMEGASFNAHVGPLYDGDGKISGAVGVAIEITEQVRAERDLRVARDHLRALSGLIPICMHCKSVRNDGGYWEQVETYVHEHSNAEFTHAICPGCMKRALDGDRIET